MPYREPEGEGSVFSTLFTATSNIIGGGSLLLPSAIHAASIIPGTIALVLMGLLAVASIFYIILCCQKTRRFTYLDLLSLSVSPRAAKAYEWVLFAYTYCILAGWARIVIDSMPPVAEDFFKIPSSSAFASSWFWLLVASVVFFAFTSLKALAHLTWTSVAGFLTILFLLIVMIIRLFQGYYTKHWDHTDTFTCATWNQTLYQIAANSSGNITSLMNETVMPLEDPQPNILHDNLPVASFSFNLVSSLPDFSVSFSMHYNVPVLYGELRRRTPLRMIRAMGGTYTIVIVFYILFALTGILTFGDGVTKSTGDVMKCYSKDDIPMNIARVLMFFHFLCVYPIVGIACRSRFEALIFAPGKIIPTWLRVSEAAGLVITTGIIALVVPGIGIVFTLAGAFFGLSIVLIVPGLFYYRIFSDDFDLEAQRAKLEAYEAEQASLAQRQKEAADLAEGLDNNGGMGGGGGGAVGGSNKEREYGTTGNQHQQPQKNNAHLLGATTHNTTLNASDESARFVHSTSDVVLRSDIALERNAAAASGVGGPDDSLHGTATEGSLSGLPVVGGGADADGSGAADGINNFSISQSIPNATDEWLAELSRNPRRWLRWLSVFSMMFGAAASVLSIVNAFMKIAEGKAG